jgi:hypothetical protein
MKRLLVLLLLLAAGLGAKDLTPYKFVFAGNGYYGPRNASVTWLAERYDCAIAGVGDWPGMHDSIYDTALAMGKEFWCGPYSSSQEINLYNRSNPGMQYNDRLKLTKDYWLYVYAKHYLDSIGVSPESLVVHISDDYVSIANDGDGLRSYSLTGLPLPKRRFSYQYWNNTSADTMFYPAGYCWLANGRNRDARNAIAYAFRRYLVDDSVSNGPGDHHWTAFFMDNQYRGGFAPRLYSYYNINSTSGGPTSDLDWYEQPGIGNNIAANTAYYDGSTMMIDSTIMAALNTACDAKGLTRIHGFANIEKFSPEHLGVALRYTNVSLENPVDYLKAWPNGWQQWYAMADTMAAHPDRYINWMFKGDFLCSSNPADWNYDSSRIYLAHYAFFLQVRDTNAFVGPARFNDTGRWRKIYEVDLGEPDAPAYEVSSTGSNYTKIAVMRRDYNNGGAAIILRTSHGSVDWVNDVVPVNMHGLYREISANADTSRTADSIFYMKPYMGKILLAAQGSASSTTVTFSNSFDGICYVGDVDTVVFTVTDQSGLDSLKIWLNRTNSDTLMISRVFPAGIPVYSGRLIYTWREDDCGFAGLTVYARNKEGGTMYRPDALKTVVARQAVDIGDAVSLISYIFMGGSLPDPSEPADANCDGELNVSDPLFIINHIFHSGPPICCPPGMFR